MLKMSEPASGSLAALAPMRLPSHSPGRYRSRCAWRAVLEDRNRVGPQVRVEREEQALVARAVAQPLHHGQQRRQAQAQPAVLFRDRHGQHAEVRTRRQASWLNVPAASAATTS